MGRAATVAVPRWLPWAGAAAVVATQVAYPLLPARGDGRLWLTAGQIVAFFVASASHAARRRGGTFTCWYLAVAVGLGLAVELVGLHTGWPFGRYTYTGRLGPEAAGVPVIIPLGWAMMAYPALLCGRHAAAVARAPAWLVTALVGGALLAGWDLFLDPRMVAEGRWAWDPGGGPRLNGIPLTNTAGWLLVGAVLVALLDRLPGQAASPTAHPGEPATHLAARDGPAPTDGPAPIDGPTPTDGPTAGRAARWLPGDGVPLFLLGWTYCSWVLACLVFFDQPAVALAGGVGMALPVTVEAAPRSRAARSARTAREHR